MQGISYLHYCLSVTRLSLVTVYPEQRSNYEQSDERVITVFTWWWVCRYRSLAVLLCCIYTASRTGPGAGHSAAVISQGARFQLCIHDRLVNTAQKLSPIQFPKLTHGS
jgi:hypothetical protein